MGRRSRELVATDETTVVAKPFLDAAVVNRIEGNGSFPNSSCTDEGDGLEVLCETNYLLNQFFAPKTGPRRRRRYFPGGDTEKNVRP